MGMEFRNLSDDELCDLMCGVPEEEECPCDDCEEQYDCGDCDYRWCEYNKKK